LRRLLEFHTYTNFSRVREWIREHIVVIDAVAKGDLETAAEALRLHLQNAGKNAVLSHLKQAAPH
ncbi:MAG: FCD domain-containing protein, partial [Mesorhizobium sp.]